VQQPAHSIIAELEDAVRDGTSAKRVQTLRRVTDLFLNDGDRLSDEQVKVFDDVLCLLIARVETRAKAELSKRLAPVDYAPFELIQHLASDDEIAVAGEVLMHSSRVSTDTLVEIASTKGQDHLLAISARANLPEEVTDVIVDRGEGKVIRKLATNASAQFSEAGYSGIIARAEDDDELIAILGLRVDRNILLQMPLEPALVIERFADGDAIEPSFQRAALPKTANAARHGVSPLPVNPAMTVSKVSVK